jgi:hypothetical protein
LFDLAQRHVHLRDGEVRQRRGVAGTGAALVDADGRTLGACLSATSVGLAALDQFDAEQTGPKSPRTVGIVGRKLDEGERSGHAEDGNDNRTRGHRWPSVPLSRTPGNDAARVNGAGPALTSTGGEE